MPPKKQPVPEPAVLAPKPTSTLIPTPPPAPIVFQVSELSYNVNGDGAAPEIRLGESSWGWQRYIVSIDGTRYAHGATVHGRSSVTIDLNRQCVSYDATVAVDDMTLGLGKLYFSVYADGVRLWQSGEIDGGDPAVPAHVNLAGRRTVRLAVEPHSSFHDLALADWAESKFTCRWLPAAFDIRVQSYSVKMTTQPAATEQRQTMRSILSLSRQVFAFDGADSTAMCEWLPPRARATEQP